MIEMQNMQPVSPVRKMLPEQQQQRERISPAGKRDSDRILSRIRFDPSQNRAMKFRTRKTPGELFRQFRPVRSPFGLHLKISGLSRISAFPKREKINRSAGPSSRIRNVPAKLSGFLPGHPPEHCFQESQRALAEPPDRIHLKYEPVRFPLPNPETEFPLFAPEKPRNYCSSKLRAIVSDRPPKLRDRIFL